MPTPERRLDKAIADYTEAIRLDPKHVKAYHGSATYYREKGDYIHVIYDCTEAIRLDPETTTLRT